MAQNWNEIKGTHLLPSCSCVFRKVLDMHCIDFFDVFKSCVKQLYSSSTFRFQKLYDGPLWELWVIGNLHGRQSISFIAYTIPVG